MNKIVSLSLAQFRLLGRAIRGAKLPVTRYRHEHATVKALRRKLCMHVEHGHWTPTAIGKQIYACRGALRPGDTVWDSASPEERAAYYRTQRHATRDDMETVHRLQARMRAAGELQDEPS
jgi:hypothetical protein